MTVKLEHTWLSIGIKLTFRSDFEDLVVLPVAIYA